MTGRSSRSRWTTSTWAGMAFAVSLPGFQAVSWCESRAVSGGHLKTRKSFVSFSWTVFSSLLANRMGTTAAIGWGRSHRRALLRNCALRLTGSARHSFGHGPSSGYCSASQTVQPTGASRVAQGQVQSHRRLAPVADLIRSASSIPMEVTSRLPSLSRTASSALVVLVFLFHCAAGFILYRGLVVSHWPICDSELIVFYAPLVIAFAAYAFVLFSSLWLRPRSVLRSFGLVVICFILVFLSTWCYMFFALNTYGS